MQPRLNQAINEALAGLDGRKPLAYVNRRFDSSHIEQRLLAVGQRNLRQMKRQRRTEGDRRCSRKSTDSRKQKRAHSFCLFQGQCFREESVHDGCRNVITHLPESSVPLSAWQESTGR
jgi:hypothetical protein